jgi:hydrogenase 3 maturation protease
MPDLREQLQHCFRSRVCVMGLGNVDHGDDGFGMYLAESISARLTRSGKVSLARNVIGAGTMPERSIGYVIAKSFDHLVFLDAVEFGGTPGSIVLLNAKELKARFPQISTHKMSLSLLAHLINESGRTRVWLLGVQPGSLKPSHGLSQAVQKTMEMLDGMLCTLWISTNDAGETSMDQKNDVLPHSPYPRKRVSSDFVKTMNSLDSRLHGNDDMTILSTPPSQR